MIDCVLFLFMYSDLSFIQPCLLSASILTEQILNNQEE